MTTLTRRGFLKTTAAVSAIAQMTSIGGVDAAPDSATKLHAGVAARTITPEPGVPMWGYSNRKQPATGALDALYAKALVLKANESSVAFVALDLGRVPLDETCNRIRARAKKAGVQAVVFIATHTHGGPIMELPDAPHVNHIEAMIGEAIEEAAQALRPARLGVGRTTIDIAHNRRVIKDGKCYMLWRNENKMPTSPVDREAVIVKLDGVDGKAIATLVNYACHPVVLGPDNLQFSADYAGEMARLVKESTGAECFFLQGAAGDINPYLDKTPLSEGGIESMRSVGKAAADAVLKSLPTINARDVETPAIQVSVRPVKIGLRWDFENPAQVDVFRNVYGQLFDAYLSQLTSELSAPLTTVVLNNDFAIVGIPGEPFVQFQLDLKAASPLPNTIMCGYTNGFHIYFPTVKGAAAGGYGGLVATYAGLGAGEKLVAEGLIDIGKLSGCVKPFLAVEDFDMPEYTQV